MGLSRFARTPSTASVLTFILTTVFAAPLLASVLSVVPAWALAGLIPDDLMGVHWWRLL